MKSENDIIENILSFAERDENIIAVIRTDLLPVRDYLYTYNFYFVVKDVEKFNSDSSFENCFGDRILLFRADNNYPEMFSNTKAHLMVFCDSITIVINAIDKNSFLEKYNNENKYENVWIGDTFQKILDKDNILPDIERLEEKQTLFSEKPTEDEFSGSCNEFWWVIKTFAEYTLRKELPSSMFYLNNPVRDMLNKMIRWHIYLKAGKTVDMGILDSNMEKLLEEDYFALYKKTYPNSDYESIWNAYAAVTDLWGKLGRDVAKRCGFHYPGKVEEDMLEFIEMLQK